MEICIPLLTTENLTKKFGKVVANDKICFEIRQREIHCLLGENGAGKSTLAECIYGFCSADSGCINFEEKQVSIKKPSDSIKLGIGMVHQHFILVSNLTVVENIIVGTDSADFFLDLSNAKKKIEKLCNDYGISLDLSAKIWQLSVAEQQWVEILKALFVGVKLLILDEPTAVLTPQESDKLFIILRKMKNDGLSILLITHKLNEVMAVADRVTVLRKGKYIETVNTEDVSKSKLAKLMVGREVIFKVDKPEVKFGAKVLEIRNLVTKNDRRQQALDNLNLFVKEGEIVGIAGVSGNGQRELFESIIGIRKIESGDIFLNGEPIKHNSIKTISAKGISHIPEDRLKEGIVPEFSISENLILGLHDSKFFKWKGLFYDEKEVDTFSKSCVNDFEIATPSAKHLTRNLSGGNIQKVVLARELSKQPKCLIANLPTRGLDVGAIEYVHKRLLMQCTKGTGILLFSDDLDEIINLSDRILVIFKGVIVGEFTPENSKIEKIGLLMAGILEGEE